jgi:hypothetical protein
MTRVRKPQPAARSSTLPGFEAVAKLLAVGSLAAIAGCRGLCPAPPGEEPIPHEQRPWWARIYAAVGCELTQPVAVQPAETTVITGGATPLVQPERLTPIPPQGGIRPWHPDPPAVPQHHRVRAHHRAAPVDIE